LDPAAVDEVGAVALLGLGAEVDGVRLEGGTLHAEALGAGAGVDRGDEVSRQDGDGGQCAALQSGTLARDGRDEELQVAEGGRLREVEGWHLCCLPGYASRAPHTLGSLLVFGSAAFPARRIVSLLTTLYYDAL